MLVQNKKKFMFGRAAKYQLFAGKRCLAFFLSIMLLMSIFQAVPVKAAGIKLYYFDTKKTVEGSPESEISMPSKLTFPVVPMYDTCLLL